jgi:hypothetical protein
LFESVVTSEHVAVAPPLTDVWHICIGAGQLGRHAPAAHTSPDGHIDVHVPFEQVWPAVHRMPHPPQLFTSDAVSAQNEPHAVSVTPDGPHWAQSRVAGPPSTLAAPQP